VEGRRQLDDGNHRSTVAAPRRGIPLDRTSECVPRQRTASSQAHQLACFPARCHSDQGPRRDPGERTPEDYGPYPSPGLPRGPAPAGRWRPELGVGRSQGHEGRPSHTAEQQVSRRAAPAGVEPHRLVPRHRHPRTSPDRRGDPGQPERIQPGAPLSSRARLELRRPRPSGAAGRARDRDRGSASVRLVHEPRLDQERRSHSRRRRGTEPCCPRRETRTWIREVPSL
jgi:hypothetical protein